MTSKYSRAGALFLSVLLLAGVAPLPVLGDEGMFLPDTLGELRRLHPASEFWLLIGADTVVDLPNWHDPARVVAYLCLPATERNGQTPHFSNSTLFPSAVSCVADSILVPTLVTTTFEPSLIA